MRFEKKKTAFSLVLGFLQSRVEQRLVPPFFFAKKNSKFLELVFPSRHILFELFVCVCVCVCCCRLGTSSSNDEQK